MCLFSIGFVVVVVFPQGGSTAVRGLWPGGGADQQTDRGIQDLPVQGGEPELYQRVGPGRSITSSRFILHALLLKSS